jgi:hypothetical protein
MPKSLSFAINRNAFDAVVAADSNHGLAMANENR